MSRTSAASWFLRLGLAFVFAYAAIEVYLNPDAFLKYVPDFVQNILPANFFLPIFGGFEVFLVLWLLSPWLVRYAALVAFAMMIGIVFSNFEYFSVLFRNVAIGFAALALAVLEWKDY